MENPILNNLGITQARLDHTETTPTEIYTHILSINNKTLKSPLDILFEKDTFEKPEPDVFT